MRRLTRRVVALAGAALGVAGCADSRDAVPGSVDSVGAGGAVDVSDSADVQPRDSLELQLELPATVKRGAPVQMALHVRNATARPLHLYLRGRSTTVDVRIEDEGGSTVWHRLEGVAVPAIIQARTLGAGASFVERVEWSGRTSEGGVVAPGRYTVRAFLLTESDPLAAPAVTVRVE